MPFICVIDTLCGGLTASWRDEDGKPVVYPTREEAEVDANDVQTDPEDREEDWEPDEPDMVIEVVVTPEKIYDPVDGRIYWENKQ